MRFRRLHAHVFGVLRGAALELPAETVLVFGSNESGKTTFRCALETLLYGFEPATRDEHPLARWDAGAGGDLKLEAEIERDAGGALRVERSLLVRGQLRVAEGNAEFEGRRQGNAPLELVRELPREIFRQVYSLELAQLAALEKQAQARVDDLLLPQAAERGLRPVAEVRAELRDEHQALWRPNRRGNPQALRLNEQLEALRGELAAAAHGERELREALLEQSQLEARRAELEAERATLDRIHEDAPLLRDLCELARRRRVLGPPIDLSALAGLPLVDPVALAREVEELKDALRGPEARLLRAEVVLDPGERALLDAAADVAVAGKLAIEMRTEAKQGADRRGAAAALREEARGQLSKVLARTPGAAEVEAARGLPLEALRSAQTQWSAAVERHAAAAPPQLPGWARIGVGANVALAVLALLLESWLGGAARPLAVAAVAAAVLVAGAAWLAHARRGPPPLPSLLSDLCAGLPPSPALLTQPAELLRFVECVASAQTTLARAAGEDLVASGIEARLQARAEQLAQLCRQLGLAADGDGEQRSARLAAALERAIANEKRVEQDRSERAIAQERIAATRPRLERASQQLARVEAVLRSAEPTAPTPALRHARVKERLEEAEFVRRREAELRRDARFAAFEADPRVSAEPDATLAEWSPVATAARASDRVRCDEELAAIHKRLGEIASLLREDEGGRQARVSDRIGELQERLAALHRERDRLALLEAILARAERRYRDEHQPPVLQRASRYLEQLTHGRWRRLEYQEGAEGGLFVSGGGRDEPVRVGEPLSRGTLDQIFLCLRLGLLDHLDDGRERLPLVLDDALLRMDDARRAAVYALLAEVSRRRQVFLLTCQTWIAAEAERALAIRRISLKG